MNGFYLSNANKDLYLRLLEQENETHYRNEIKRHYRDIVNVLGVKAARQWRRENMAGASLREASQVC